METFDAVIVGAGPAGLTAATYLGRYRRRVLVLNGGLPRASWIPRSHNTPGFPGGVAGPELLSRLRAQAKRYGAHIREGRAGDLDKDGDNFRFDLERGAVAAPFALLATGLIDHKPDVPGLDGAIRQSLVRLCPICDAFEAIDKRIAVLGDGDLGAREALFLSTYSQRVALLHLGRAADLKDSAKLEASGVEMLEVDIGAISLKPRTVSVALRATGRPRRFDHLYLALGCEMENRLAVKWGADHDKDGKLIVDAHQQTSIDGVYAAGDVVLGLNQIAIASAEAAIAATAIHNKLRT